MFDLEELEEMLKNVTLVHNSSPVKTFENYSPFEMSNILNKSFGSDSIINFKNNITNDTYWQIPFLNNIKYFLNILKKEKNNTIKLTAAGYLPVKFVKELYQQHYIPESHIDSGMVSLERELFSDSVHLTRVISSLAGFVYANNNKNTISLTESGKLHADDDGKNSSFLKTLFKTFYNKYNFAYLDEYPDFDFHQTFPFLIVLINKYGNVERRISFYFEKMLEAFPSFSDVDEYELSSGFSNEDFFGDECLAAFSLRLFERFLCFFNFVEYDIKSTYIKKSEIFDNIFLILPPGQLLDKPERFI